jgi:S1-C subfamily serine protease
MDVVKLLLAAVGGGLVAATIVLCTPKGDPDPVALLTTAGGAPELYWSTPPSTDTSTGDLPVAAVDLRRAARRATPAVVHVDARVMGRDRATVKRLFGREESSGTTGGEGSGVIYTPDGYLITNYHVVQAADRLTVTTSDRRRYPATVVGVEPKTDLAVLKIEADSLPHLSWANSDRAEPGQWVLAVGSPLGLTSTVTAGIISAKGRNLSVLRDPDAIESFIQTDAAVNPGNSGGPLVDADGKLLGINTAIASRTGRFQGYSFAIPANLVRRIVDDIIAYGTFRRAQLGVEISSLTAADIERLDLGQRGEGVVVDAILEGGAAEAGGLRVDDVIVTVNDRKLRDLPEFTEMVGRARPGDIMNLRVIRNRRETDLRVKLRAVAE